jgi:hypothetical protein
MFKVFRPSRKTLTQNPATLPYLYAKSVFSSSIRKKVRQNATLFLPERHFVMFSALNDENTLFMFNALINEQMLLR